MTSELTHALDTVDHAAATPEQPQPFRELGLKDDEYQRIREILGRRPTDAELAMYSVMWSEHCSYKSSKVHLRYFGETTTEAMRASMLAGIGENAGVVDIGDGWAATFKVESHNHPSYIEPYQGAATGVGGIVRDIMAMGARPVAVMDQLRFGGADAADTRRVVDGVVRGIGGYGNSLGLPNIGGETVFDASYAGNPLVNALCVGVLRKEDLHLAFASGTGNKIILFGARTGLDGIGGVSVLASETFGGEEEGTGTGSKLDPANFFTMIDGVVARHPHIKIVATTLREVYSATRHCWGAVAWVGGGQHVSMTCDLDVHDRVGGGDGFASGFFYGLLAGESPDEALKLGWAHGALLTTFPGDTTMATLEEVRAFAKGGSARIQR